MGKTLSRMYWKAPENSRWSRKSRYLENYKQVFGLHGQWEIFFFLGQWMLRIWKRNSHSDNKCFTRKKYQWKKQRPNLEEGKIIKCVCKSIWTGKYQINIQTNLPSSSYLGSVLPWTFVSSRLFLSKVKTNIYLVLQNMKWDLSSKDLPKISYKRQFCFNMQ